jgi:hypothetical protein
MGQKQEGIPMKQQISLQQYRAIDLGILGVSMAVSQLLIQFAVSVWFPGQLYVVSPVAIIVALVMMRWGPWTAIHAALGGVLYAYFSGGQWQHFLIYGLGNAACLLALVMIRLLGKEKIRLSAVNTVIFGLLVQALMLAGRAGVAALLGFKPGECLGFITTDALSLLFTGCVIWGIRRVDGLFEDQIHYLLRVQSEQSTEGREQL